MVVPWFSQQEAVSQGVRRALGAALQGSECMDGSREGLRVDLECVVGQALVAPLVGVVWLSWLLPCSQERFSHLLLNLD